MSLKKVDFSGRLLTTILRDNRVDSHQQNEEDRSHIDHPLSRLPSVTRDHCTLNTTVAAFHL